MRYDIYLSAVVSVEAEDDSEANSLANEIADAMAGAAEGEPAVIAPWAFVDVNDFEPIETE